MTNRKIIKLEAAGKVGAMVAAAVLTLPAWAQSNDPVYADMPAAVALQMPLLTQGALTTARSGGGAWFDRQSDLRDSFGRLSKFDAEIGSGGIWARVGGDYAGHDVRQFIPGEDTGGSEPPEPVSINNDYDQDTFSLNFGADLVRGGTEDGRRWLAGATLGYARSTMDFKQSGSEIDFDSVGAGVYASYVGQQLFVDAQLLFSWMKADLDAPALAIGIADTLLSTDVETMSLNVEGGWRIALNDRLRLEPLVALSWLRMRTDDLNITPSDPLTNGAIGNSVDFDALDSQRAALGLRVSVLQTVSNLNLEYALTGRYWQEFERDRDTTIRVKGNTPTDPDTFVSANYRADSGYGELVAGISLGTSDGSISAVLNATGRFASNYDAYGATVGVRYQW